MRVFKFIIGIDKMLMLSRFWVLMEKFFISKGFAFGIAFIGFVIIIYYALEPPFNDGSAIPDADMFAKYGNFVGGLAGSLLLFSSIILLYISINNQRKSSEIERFDNTFFNLINYYNSQVASLEDFPKPHKSRDVKYLKYVSGWIETDSPPNIGWINCEEIYNKSISDPKLFHQNVILNLGKGKQLLNNLYQNMKGAYDCHINYFEKNKKHKKDDVIMNIHNHLEAYPHILKSYFRNVFSILVYISKSQIADKQKYSEIFLNLLTQEELVLLYYYSLYDSSKEEKSEFKQLFFDFKIHERIDDHYYFHEKDKNLLID